MNQASIQEKTSLVRGMRKEPTPSEAALWEALRNHRLDGLAFRRQHPVPMTRYVADFCCPARRLIVEIDGRYHDADSQKLLDRERQSLMEQLGYLFVRVSVDEVIGDLPAVLLQIRMAASKNDGVVEAIPLRFGEGKFG